MTEPLSAISMDEVPVCSRFPVIRTGEREPLPELLRWLIWHRDNGTCKLCGISNVSTEIDHVVPWSAGGPDVSTNLRILCGRCNQYRSNYRLWETPRLRRVAQICDRCIINHDAIMNSSLHRRYYPACPVCAGYDVNHPDDLEDASVLAFCGSCRSMSTVTGSRWLM
jgi:HNH endonuclease